MADSTSEARTIGVFVQARMTSQRLPGKILRETAGKPLLGYLLERLDHCRQPARIVVLTSTDPSDEPIADYCRRQNRLCFRGDLYNVAGRFGEALNAHPVEGFVRVSGDSPLLDPALVDRAIALFHSGRWDLVTNVMERTFPPGQSVEVVASRVFQDTLPCMRDQEDLEHVTTYFYRNHREFRICTITASETVNLARLSVDTTSDWQVFCRIVACFDRPQWQYGLAEVLELYQRVTGTPA